MSKVYKVFTDTEIWRPELLNANFDCIKKILQRKGLRIEVTKIKSRPWV